MSKRALITGISGQDGAYLAQLLLGKDYEVFGAARYGSTPSTWRLEELDILEDIEFVPLEMLEFANILRAIERLRPDEIYNLAAQSFVPLSFEQPIYTSEVNGIGAARILEAIREVNPGIRFYQASTSEMFGEVAETPQTERTPFRPRSHYATAKLYAHWTTVNYREAHGLHATSGILFNHESPLRGEHFVTRKITRALARIARGEQEVLRLGNLDARRDWGFAGDYVDGMWRMLQQDTPDDYVLATGRAHTVREFVETAAISAGFGPIHWVGSGACERGFVVGTNRVIVQADPTLYRPAEVDALLGDASKARSAMDWQPKVTVKELAAKMIEADLRRAMVGELH